MVGGSDPAGPNSPYFTLGGEKIYFSVSSRNM